MKTRLLLLAVLLINTKWTFAQDLIRKVPADATVVFTYNNKAFFEKVGVAKLNTTLAKFGFFEKAFSSNISNIEDLGIDLNSKAYTYVSLKDSVNYIGTLIPLANKEQFESIISLKNEIMQVNNLPTVYSSDRQLRMSWDNHTIYILVATENSNFFRKQDVMTRYGLLPLYENDYYGTMSDEDAVYWEDTEFEDVTDTIMIFDEDDYSIVDTFMTSEAEAYEMDEDYSVVDSILAKEDYTSTYYKKHDSIYNYNDSIKNNLLATWVEVEFSKLLNNDNPPNSKLKSLSNNTLIHIYSADISVFLRLLYGLDSSYGYLQNLSPNNLLNVDLNELNFGLKSFEGKLNVKDNILNFTTDLSLRNDLASKYKEMYKKGVNPKFYKYLDKDILGFLSVNISTESYLKNTPALLNKYYGSLFPNAKDYIDLGATIFEISLDEKAIGKVFKGDNLLVFNGVTEQSVTYVDYDYNDEYEYVEIEKTKIETVPQFLWMFSSEDTRIFQKMLQIGVRRNKIVDTNGIYTLIPRNKSSFEIYFLIKDGIVFIGNDFDKFNLIKNNSTIFKSHAPYVALAKKNSAAFVLNAKRISSLIEELQLPINSEFEHFVNDLKQYGDLSITSPGIVGDSFKTDFTVEFPKNNANALQYILNVIDLSVSSKY